MINTLCYITFSFLFCNKSWNPYNIYQYQYLYWTISKKIHLSIRNFIYIMDSPSFFFIYLNDDDMMIILINCWWSPSPFPPKNRGNNSYLPSLYLPFFLLSGTILVYSFLEIIKKIQKKRNQKYTRKKNFSLKKFHKNFIQKKKKRMLNYPHM